MTCFFMDRFESVKNDCKLPGRMRDGDVVRAESNRVREGNGRRFQGRRKGKEKSFCHVMTQKLYLDPTYLTLAEDKVESVL